MRSRHIFLALVLFPVTAGLAQEPAPAEVPAGLSLARIFTDHGLVDHSHWPTYEPSQYNI